MLDSTSHEYVHPLEVHETACQIHIQQERHFGIVAVLVTARRGATTVPTTEAAKGADLKAVAAELRA